jgi:hypothetical protein
MDLPNVILLNIVDFLDPKALAKTAQVSKEWRRLVYRPSVWLNLRWRERNYDYFYRSEYLPAHIRHIGEPTDLCFTAWLASKLRHTDERFMANMPREIILLKNVNEFMRAMRKYWNSENKPCVHTHHHKWSDVLKCRTHLNSLTENDVTRIHYRLVNHPESDIMNQYRFWLTEHLGDLGRCNIHSISEMGTRESTDILHILTAKVDHTNQSRRGAYWKLRERAKQKYHDSIKALGNIGMVEFEENERYVDKHYKY